MAEQVDQTKTKLQLPKAMMLVIILPWVLMIIGFAIFLLGQKMIAKNNVVATTTAVETTAKTEAKTPKPGVTYEMKEFLVNLKAPEDHHLKLTLALQLNKGVKTDEVKVYEAKIRYIVVSNLRTKTIGDLNQPNGLETMRFQLKNVINRIVPDNKVYDVLITDCIYD